MSGRSLSTHPSIGSEEMSGPYYDEMSGPYNDEMSDSYPFIDTVESTVFVCAEIYFKDSP
jgi:hypothetical protein